MQYNSKVSGPKIAPTTSKHACRCFSPSLCMHGPDWQNAGHKKRANLTSALMCPRRPTKPATHNEAHASGQSGQAASWSPPPCAFPVLPRTCPVVTPAPLAARGRISVAWVLSRPASRPQSGKRPLIGPILISDRGATGGKGHTRGGSSSCLHVLAHRPAILTGQAWPEMPPAMELTLGWVFFGAGILDQFW